MCSSICILRNVYNLEGESWCVLFCFISLVLFYFVDFILSFSFPSNVHKYGIKHNKIFTKELKKIKSMHQTPINIFLNLFI